MFHVEDLTESIVFGVGDEVLKQSNKEWKVDCYIHAFIHIQLPPVRDSNSRAPLVKKSITVQRSQNNKESRSGDGVGEIGRGLWVIIVFDQLEKLPTVQDNTDADLASRPLCHPSLGLQKLSKAGSGKASQAHSSV